MSLEMEYQRVKKLDTPLLVIGLGGTGAAGVRAVRELFRKRYELPQDDDGRFSDRPIRTEYLVIDSSNVTGEQFKPSDFFNITVPGLAAILDPQRRNANLEAYEREWLHERMNAVSDGNGACMRRQASRLMLFRNYPRVETSIRQKLLSISQANRGEVGDENTRIEVVIITGICGGTGSGIFLDIAQILRYLSRSPGFTGTLIHITSYIVMPDVNLSASNDVTLQTVWKSNSFAALKELDFWMNVDEHKTPYTATFPNGVKVPWDMAPFDQCALLSGTDVGGNRYDNPTRVVMDTLAENLLHYLSYEPTDKDTPYKFIEHENNISTAKQNQHHVKPMGHFYRIIGAFSSFVPKKRMLNYEGKLVLENVIPYQNEFGQDVLALKLIREDRLTDRAKEITGDIDLLGRTEINQCAALPRGVSSDPASQADMQMIRNLASPLHDAAVVDQWMRRVVKPGVENSADQYLSKAWARFSSFAQEIITHKDEGPFCLYRYITDEKQGMLQEMRKTLVAWQAEENRAHVSAARGNGNCNNVYRAFQNPGLFNNLIAPLLRLFKVETIEEAYLQQLKAYYCDMRKEAFCGSYAARLERMIRMIEDYAVSSLRPICDALKKLKVSCDEVISTPAMNGEEMVDFSAIQSNVADAFVAANTDDQVTNAVLKAICERSLEFERTNMENGVGIKWPLNTQTAEKELSGVIERQLEETFGTLLGKSADTVTQQVYQDAEARKKHIDAICRQLILNAQPLYQSDVATLSNAIKYAFVSIPSDAPEYARSFVEQIPTAGISMTNPKMSTITDQIYCLISWDGVPLYTYSLMPALESAYEEYCRNNAGDKGIHLVQTPEDVYSGSVRNNWAHLPSPMPYYIFSLVPGAFAQKAYEDVRKTAEAALEAGSLSYDDTVRDRIAYNVRFFFNGDSQTMLEPSAEIIKICSDVLGQTKLSPQARLEELLRVERNASSRPRSSGDESPSFQPQHPSMMKQPIDPWDARIQADPSLRETAMKNHHILAFDQVVYKLTLDPYATYSLAEQTQGFQCLSRAIRETRLTVEQTANLILEWEQVTAFSPVFANMLCYGILKPAFGDYSYVDYAGEDSLLMEQARELGIETDATVPESLPLIRAVKVLYRMTRADQAKPTVDFLNSRLATLMDRKSIMKRTGDEFRNWLADAARLKLQFDGKDGEINVLNYSPPAGLEAEMRTKYLELLNGMLATVNTFISSCNIALSQHS